MCNSAKVVLLSALALALVARSGATTLQKLGLDEMIQQSTGIVRAKVTGVRTGTVKSDIFTFYRLEVLESLKGAAQREIAIPGGAAGGQRQMVAGAPELTIGQEYVVFYWTSKSGITQLLGLSQGLFSERFDVVGNPLLVRPASTETMLGKDGTPIRDLPMSLHLNDMRVRVQKVLDAGSLATNSATNPVGKGTRK